MLCEKRVVTIVQKRQDWFSMHEKLFQELGEKYPYVRSKPDARHN